MKKNLNQYMGGLLLIASFLVVAGCNMDIKDYCAKWAECEDGNKADERACIDEMKAERKVADVYGCKAQFDDWAACLVDKSVCLEVSYPVNALSSSDVVDTSSDSPMYYYTDDQNCNAEESAYSDCIYP
jgi:hypothetical protein